MPSLGALIALQSGSQMAILVIRPFHPSTQWAIRPPADEVNTERDDSSEHRNFWGQGEYQRPQTDDERDEYPGGGGVVHRESRGRAVLLGQLAICATHGTHSTSVQDPGWSARVTEDGPDGATENHRTGRHPERRSAGLCGDDRRLDRTRRS